MQLLFFEEVYKSRERRVLHCKAGGSQDPLLLSPVPSAWEKWVGTEGRRLIIFTGYIITLSGSH